jgi:hypothetical protein
MLRSVSILSLAVVLVSCSSKERISTEDVHVSETAPVGSFKEQPQSDPKLNSTLSGPTGQTSETVIEFGDGAKYKYFRNSEPGVSTNHQLIIKTRMTYEDNGVFRGEDLETRCTRIKENDPQGFACNSPEIKNEKISEMLSQESDCFLKDGVVTSHETHGGFYALKSGDTVNDVVYDVTVSSGLIACGNHKFFGRGTSETIIVRDRTIDLENPTQARTLLKKTTMTLQNGSQVVHSRYEVLSLFSRNETHTR